VEVQPMTTQGSMAGRRGGPSTGTGGSQSIAAVERALDVLLLFDRSGDAAIGVTEIADTLGMPKAAVHRVLTSLRTRDLVYLDPATRRYSLGPRALAFGLSHLNSLDVVSLSRPRLRVLVDATGETATLSIRAGQARMYVERVLPNREMRLDVALGVTYPLHAGSSSKSLLAFLDPVEVEAYLRGHALDPLTKNTITSVAKLRDELRAVHRLGYATSVSERQSGAASVAAPIFDHRGQPVAVVSVCGPAERFNPSAYIDTVLGTAREISTQMGYQAGTAS
jgi:DNA-binding IclR family transcriptional regulator